MAGVVVFVRIFFRKFWQLVQLNILFLVFNLPAIVVMPFIAQLLLHSLTINPGSIVNSGYELLLYFIVGVILVCIPMLTVGPAQAGFTYVLRNFAREEHAFLWGDFKEHALSNARQSSIICVIDLVIVLVMAFNINFYVRLSEKNIVLTLVTSLVILLFLLYLMMHMYIYPMLVTFRLSVAQIYKNALIFSLIRFVPNLGILVLCVILTALPLLLFPVMGVLLFSLIMMSVIGLITNLYVRPILKRYTYR